MMDPNKINKYLYIDKTPTWLVRATYAIGICVWSLVLYEYTIAAMYNSFYFWVIYPFIIIFTVYLFLSFGLNLFYRRFDLKKHFPLVSQFWSTINNNYPSVNVFLPICGEDQRDSNTHMGKRISAQL